MKIEASCSANARQGVYGYNRCIKMEKYLCRMLMQVIESHIWNERFDTLYLIIICLDIFEV